MRLILDMLTVKFLVLFLMGVWVAWMNTDDAGLFIEPFLTQVATVLSLVGMFGVAGCRFIIHDLKIND